MELPSSKADVKHDLLSVFLTSSLEYSNKKSCNPVKVGALNPNLALKVLYGSIGIKTVENNVAYS